MKFSGNLDIFNNITILFKDALRYSSDVIIDIYNLMNEKDNAS